MNFWSFDSFQGLPAHKNNKLQNEWHMPRLLSTSEKEFKRLVLHFSKYRKIKCIKGFYKDSFNNVLYKILQRIKLLPFINTDCDLENSVGDSLNFALKFIRNHTILYIDDYNNTYYGDPRRGIPKITKLLLKKYKIRCEYWHQSSSCGRSFLFYK